MSSSYFEDPILYQSGKPVFYLSRQRTWDNTPSFWTMHDKEYLLPINYYLDSKILRTQKLGREVSTRRDTGVVVSDQSIGYANPWDLTARHNELSGFIAESETSDVMLENEAAVKALQKLADAKINLAVSAAEARKTIDLVLGKANQIYEAMRAVRRGNIGVALEYLQISTHSHKFSRSKLSRFSKGTRTRSKAGYTTSTSIHWEKQWLELRYGWMPLLMDIQGAAEAITDRIHGGRLPWCQAIGTSKSEGRYASSGSSTYSAGSHWTEAGNSVKTFKVKIVAEISNPHLNQAQQLGLTNPALVAWELVPFSFVFDWFVSVGDYLTAVTALQGVIVRRAFVSRIREVHTEYISHAHPYLTSVNSVSGYDFSFKSAGRSYERKPYVVNPLFLFPPVNRDPLNFKRLVTGLALLKGNARGLRV